LGASGAGKTTLLNLLSGLLAPSGGRVLFGGVDVSAVPGRARSVAQVFQFPVLYESLSVEDNLAFPLRIKKAARAQVEQRLRVVCEELELTALRTAKPRSLSLFEKQLVAVGKALVRPDVSLVLLDEPLTAVEPRVKWRLRQSLRRVQADLGVTMIYVTHDQTEALTFADRVSVLTTEGILQTDTPEVIYRSPNHEFVGHFVGSPGMNFVPAAALDVAGAQRLGFRAEWAELDSRARLRGRVTRERVLGTRDGEPFGLVTIDTAHGLVTVRGRLPRAALLGRETGIRVQRYVAFVDELKVGEGEFL
jgi:glycerol transport system ATP-binding protein